MTEEKERAVRSEPSNPKRVKGSFGCMVSINKFTHPPCFIRRAGCHANLGLPGSCELLLHTYRVLDPITGCHTRLGFPGNTVDSQKIV